MKETRFRVIGVRAAKEQGLPGLGKWDEDHEAALYDFKHSPPVLITTDRMEPEDVSFYRDLAWVVRLLNEVDNEG